MLYGWNGFVFHKATLDIYERYLLSVHVENFTIHTTRYYCFAKLVYYYRNAKYWALMLQALSFFLVRNGVHCAMYRNMASIKNLVCLHLANANNRKFCKDFPILLQISLPDLSRNDHEGYWSSRAHYCTREGYLLERTGCIEEKQAYWKENKTC